MNSTNTVGVNSTSFNHLMIDAGALYKNYGLANEALIGATSGGNEFDVKPKFYQPKIDGVKSSNVRGLEFLTDVDITLKTNLLELTSDILKMALVGQVDTETSNEYDIITSKTIITDADYIDNIALVGKISGSDKPVVIIIKNALNIDGIQAKREDSKDNVMPVTFTAHVDPNNPSMLPYEVHFPKLTPQA